ncbi:DNA topoisomerase IV subunit A [Arcticibacter svalbardensis MN12-7]|uniref:DNA topoisomerase IV subunit A n=1 Tax=Arcticibacter svalbardensis MN12-7 TaxID=1150600 RepID=R9GV69_9SPHI|nr:tail fiber domain-containing protein [Arcticibacter svalbardensis]EOR95727.1 DNA topoisomerase IV subunit A [Arcticibacter svalbardensis MN12-7]
MKVLSFITGLSLMGISCLTLSVSAQTNRPTNSELIKQSSPLINTLSDINQLNPVIFEYDTNQSQKLKLPSGQQYGFIAEDVHKIRPELVKSSKKMIPAGKNAFNTVDVKDVDMNSIIALLVASVKEQQIEIERLKSEMQSLKSISAR